MIPEGVKVEKRKKYRYIASERFLVKLHGRTHNFLRLIPSKQKSLLITLVICFLDNQLVSRFKKNKNCA